MAIRRSPIERTAPWRMCRTCHRKGTTARTECRWVQGGHEVGRVGKCGQCGARRPLVTCHMYDFTKPPKPKRAKKPKWLLPTPTMSQADKDQAEFERIYGSEDRLEWVKAQPSVASGLGPCVNAHVISGGTGRKADSRWIVPLTDHEHMEELHHHGRAWFEAKYHIDLVDEAIKTETRWQTHLTLREIEPAGMTGGRDARFTSRPNAAPRRE